MLEVINLCVSVEDNQKQGSESKEIIKGVSLKFEAGKVHALMGPNGSGKSTLANALMGHPSYQITSGKILLNGVDITKAKPEDRAKAGLFLSFQYPSAVAGVTLGNFMRTAVNTLRENRGESHYSVVEFYKILKEKMAELKMDSSFLNRDMNAGFSGGEKKRVEILQLMLLHPKYALLDETDSGLDVDAIKVVAEEINKVKLSERNMGVIVITHYQRFLQFLNPDMVSVLTDGRIIASGGKELAEKIEKDGFMEVLNA